MLVIKLGYQISHGFHSVHFLPCNIRLDQRLVDEAETQISLQSLGSSLFLQLFPKQHNFSSSIAEGIEGKVDSLIPMFQGLTPFRFFLRTRMIAEVVRNRIREVDH